MTVFLSKYKGESALLLTTLLWGATFVIVKESLRDVSPMLFIGFRFSLATLLFIPFIFKAHRGFNKKALLAGGFLGVLLFVSFAAQTVGLQYTTATKSGFLTGTLVVLIPFFQIFIKKKKPSKGVLIGAGLVFIGILILSSGGGSIFTFLSELGGNFNFGDFLTLVCAVLFALHVVYLDVFSHKHDYWFLVFAQLFVTAVSSFIFAYFFNMFNFELYRFSLTNNLIIGVVYTALFATLINMILQTKYQKFVSPTKAGIIYSFEPIFSAIFAFMVLGELITGLGFIGGLLIFSGLIVAEIYDNFVRDNGK